MGKKRLDGGKYDDGDPTVSLLCSLETYKNFGWLLLHQVHWNSAHVSFHVKLVCTKHLRALAFMWMPQLGLDELDWGITAKIKLNQKHQDLHENKTAPLIEVCFFVDLIQKRFLHSTD